MPKTKISEFSATPANNTDIDSINIAEGCAPSGINDAIRELMAQLKDFQTGAVGDSFNGPIGATTASTGAFTTLSSTGNTTLGDASGDAVTVNGTATFANANPTLTAGTANGVTYLNGSKVLTSGSALVFDGSNLGVGVTPSEKLEIYGTTPIFQINDRGLYQAQFGLIGNDLEIRGSSGVIEFYNGAADGASSTLKATLDASGNLGIGTSSPARKLDVVGAIRSAGVSNPYVEINNGTSSGYLELRGGSNDLNIEVSGANSQIFRTNNSERMRIDSSGNLLVGITSSTDIAGTTNNGWMLKNNQIQHTASGTNMYLTNSVGGSTTFVTFYSQSTGVGSIATNGSITLFNTTSDQRLKQNIVDAPEFGSVIDSIKVRSFDWKTNQSHQRAGFVAQELVTVAPEAVYQPTDTDEMMAVDYSKLVPMLVKEIQSLRVRVAQLETN